MIVTEYYMTRPDGVVLNRTYSDSDHLIERDGVLYTEAVDPAEEKRVYTETNVPIVSGDIEEKANAFDILMGMR